MHRVLRSLEFMEEHGFVVTDLTSRGLMKGKAGQA
jgi:hypothetical protein